MVAVGFLGFVAVPVAVGSEDKDLIMVGRNDALPFRDEFFVELLAGF